MSGFSDRFQHWLPPTDSEKITAVTTGLVVLDANVLLDAYRFGARQREELFKALERVTDRLWVPDQVASEFHVNRASVVATYDSAYQTAINAVRTAHKQVDDLIGDKLRHLVNRTGLLQADAENIQRSAIGGLIDAEQALTRLQAEHGVPKDALYNDPTLTRLQELLDGKVGQPFTKEEEAKARAEADRRNEHKIPPGFKDARKDGPRAHGDYLLWAQTLREAKRRNLPLLLVTRDEKDDWMWSESGKTVAARPELVDECWRVAGVRLVVMKTVTFLRYVSEHLQVEVSNETLRQAVSPSYAIEEIIAQELRSAEDARHHSEVARERLFNAQSEASEARGTLQQVGNLLKEAEAQGHKYRIADLSMKFEELAAVLRELERFVLVRTDQYEHARIVAERAQASLDAARALQQG